MAAEFVNPQFQNPDILRSMALGQQMANNQAMAPVELAGAQQDQQYRGLQMDQLRQTLVQQGLIQNYARQLAGQTQSGSQPTQSGGAVGGPSGGIQNGPQGSVSASGSDQFQMPPVNTMMALDVLQGRDPLQSAKYAQQNVLEQKKLQLQGPINLAQQIQADPQANIVINNNPQLKQMFGQWAAARGMNPNDPTVLTVANAQRAARDYEGQLQGQLGAPSTAGFTGTLKPGEAAYQNGSMVAGSADQLTPDQKAHLDLERARLGLEQHRVAQEDQFRHVPGGYEPDPATPGGVRPIAGGPHDPNAVAAGLDSRSGVMFQRVAASAQNAVASLKNIMELPVTASTGWFGTATPGTGLMSSAKSVLANKMQPQEVQDMKVMIAGVSRNLATIEAAGLSPGGALTHAMDNVTIGEGDTQLTKLRKMAEMRQIITENLKTNLANPKLPPTQKELVTNIISEVEKAVPFTNHDITQLQQSKNPKATIMDFADTSGTMAQADKNSAHPPDIQSLINKYGK